MIKAYRHLYERIEILTMDGKSAGYAWVIKQEHRSEWAKHLRPAHLKFLHSLEPFEALIVCLSNDPFNALKELWLKRTR